MPAKNKKYIIVDGEIYTDEAAAAQARELAAHRAQQHTQAPTTSTGSHGAAMRPSTGHGSSGFSPSQPPFMVLPRSNTDTFGLPDIAVFGIRLPAIALIGILLLVWRFGVKGLLFGAMLLYFIKASQGSGAPRGAASNTAGTTGQTGQPVSNAVSGLLGSLGLTPPQTPPGRQMQQTPTTASAATTTSHNADQQVPQGSAFVGKGYKLGSKD